MKFELRPAAQLDLDDAYAWYEEQKAGLGDEFLEGVEASFSTVKEGPLRYRVRHRDIRSVLVRRFPYLVLYRVLADRVVVVACFHSSRDSRSWGRRR